jgi:predicted RNA-binding Zn-ribbon protein involved in translation (DUF1610 family)
MNDKERLPVRDCPRCGVAMVSRKDDARSVGDDTYECVFCGTVVNFPFEESKSAKMAARPGR